MFIKNNNNRYLRSCPDEQSELILHTKADEKMTHLYFRVDQNTEFVQR